MAIMREDTILFQKKNLMQFFVRMLIFLTKKDGIWRYNKHYKYINFIFLFLQGHEDLDAKKAFVFYRKMLLWSDRL